MSATYRVRCPRCGEPDIEVWATPYVMSFECNNCIASDETHSFSTAERAQMEREYHDTFDMDDPPRNDGGDSPSYRAAMQDAGRGRNLR